MALYREKSEVINAMQLTPETAAQVPDFLGISPETLQAFGYMYEEQPSGLGRYLLPNRLVHPQGAIGCVDGNYLMLSDQSLAVMGAREFELRYEPAGWHAIGNQGESEQD